MLNWHEAKLVIRNHIKERSCDDWSFCRNENQDVEVAELETDFIFWIVVDGFVEFDSTKHFRENGRQVPRYYETKKEAQDAAIEMLRRIHNYEIGIACDDVSRA